LEEVEIPGLLRGLVTDLTGVVLAILLLLTDEVEELDVTDLRELVD